HAQPAVADHRLSAGIDGDHPALRQGRRHPRPPFYASLRIAILTYMAGSLFCALAPSMLILIFGRVLHGLGGGAPWPMGMLGLGALASRRERGRYYGYFAAIYPTAGGCGPLLGGLIADHLHWSVIFWINIPMGLAALAITTSLLRRLPRYERPHL